MRGQALGKQMFRRTTRGRRSMQVFVHKEMGRGTGVKALSCNQFLTKFGGLVLVKNEDTQQSLVKQWVQKPRCGKGGVKKNERRGRFY